MRHKVATRWRSIADSTRQFFKKRINFLLYFIKIWFNKNVAISPIFNSLAIKSNHLVPDTTSSIGKSDVQSASATLSLKVHPSSVVIDPLLTTEIKSRLLNYVVTYQKLSTDLHAISRTIPSLIVDIEHAEKILSAYKTAAGYADSTVTAAKKALEAINNRSPISSCSLYNLIAAADEEANATSAGISYAKSLYFPPNSVTRPLRSTTVNSSQEQLTHDSHNKLLKYLNLH